MAAGVDVVVVSYRSADLLRECLAPSRPALANAAVYLGIGLKLFLSLLVNGARLLAVMLGRRGDYDSASG